MQIAVITPSAKVIPIDTGMAPKEQFAHGNEANENPDIVKDKVGEFIVRKVATKTVSSKKIKAQVITPAKGSLIAVDMMHAHKKSARNLKGVTLFKKDSPGQTGQVSAFGGNVPTTNTETPKTAYNNLGMQKPATSGYSGKFKQNSSRKIPGSKKKI
jgi:hypothetical protein